ncbi:hypothetical protein EOK75_02990 [Pseudorhodobacter turbinis]|uniref:Uncharacterized protein n=1 Tax=Pseudorhodobacter turbinis TaxID=2500533 RepID=A0A4P8EDZ9_9RHOB|nr:hypothetical protein [Pseudorhodobacter turbinis]QCO54843.1 hypothetical protein EOK75_02990 [Pseudorhodobacter turbinis]
MTDEKGIQRLNVVKAEFRKLLDFHEKSFAEIDTKARYWLTLTLPSFVALMGYMFKQGTTMSLPLLVANSALAACLFVSTILFSSVLVSRRVESGVLIPASRQIGDLAWYLETDENWAELHHDQAAEMLRSIANNETQNNFKAAQMRRGEVSLLRGAPTAICLAGGSALLYTTTCPSWLATVATGIGTSGPTTGSVAATGIAIGVGTAAAFILADHFSTKC